ncbi:twin-arginine translocation signal domain-containing protein [Pseudomonas aeruginosa]
MRTTRDERRHTKSPHEETHGLNRRGFLGASALTGAAALVGASALGSAVVGREARAAGKGERSKAEVAPGELDVSTTGSGAADIPAKYACSACRRCAS